MEPGSFDAHWISDLRGFKAAFDPRDRIGQACCAAKWGATLRSGFGRYTYKYGPPSIAAPCRFHRHNWRCPRLALNTGLICRNRDGRLGSQYRLDKQPGTSL